MMSFQVGFGAIYGEFGMVFPVPLLAIPFRESAAGIGVPFVERIAWLAPDSWSIRAGTVDRIAGRLENRSK